MSRVGKLFFALLLLPSVLFMAGCGDECSLAVDCPGSQICYKGECRAALLDTTKCNSDQDCGGAASTGGTRAYLCVTGRCRLNPNFGKTNPVPTSDGGQTDSGSSSGSDSGPRD